MGFTTHSLAQASRLCLVIESTNETLAPETAGASLAQASRLCLVKRHQLGKEIVLSIFIFIYIGLHYSQAQIKSSDYHLIRNDLPNSFIKFNKNKNGRVAFLGGSITYNPGWRDSISSYIENRFPNTTFDFIAAGIPSMGSTPGAFRIERDILSKGTIDLLFVEAAVNDPTNGRSSTEQIRAMEGIIRHARRSNPAIDIVAMYFVDPEKMKDYNNGRTPDVIKNHEFVVNQYQVSSINLAREVTDRINAGEFNWKDDFKNLHPSPFGQLIYYNSLKSFLEGVWKRDSVSEEKIIKHPLPGKLDQFSYDKGKLIPIKKAELSNGWNIDPFWKPSKKVGTRAGYVNVSMLISEKPGSKFTLKFKGKAIGIAVAAGPDAGIIEYSIDGGDFRKLDLFTQWSSHLHLPWYYVLDAELASSKHTITIRISNQKNENSKGNTCRIKHFFINEY